MNLTDMSAACAHARPCGCVFVREGVHVCEGVDMCVREGGCVWERGWICV